MLQTPFYDPKKSYYENIDQGPFGIFADKKVFKDSGEPQYEVFGQKVYFPFGIPAGPLLNGKFIKAALDKGFDIPMQKTVRTRKKKCHPWPNVLSVKVDGDLTPEKVKKKLIADEEYTEPLSITNSFGNPSFDPDIWQPDIANTVKHAKKGQFVAASYEGTNWENGGTQDYINDWILGARLLKETGVGFIEMNFSCPNEGTTNLLCFDVKKSQRISEAVKNEIGNTPLVIKMAYFEEKTLVDFIQTLGNIVDGFAAINTIAAEIIDKDGKQALPGEGRARSGVCGSTIKWAGIDMVKRIKKLRDESGMDFAIIGVGGVTVAKDYFDYISAGADVVMSATGAMWNPNLAIDIKTMYSESNLTS